MSIYAVVETGGKQYRVQPGDILQVEKLPGERGAQVKFDQVLFAAKPEGDQATKVWIGKPTLAGASVGAEIVGQGRGEKLLIVKMKRRKQYRRTQGHRQEYTQLLITSLDTGAGERAELGAEDRKKKLAGFTSQLKPKGLAFTPALSTVPKAARPNQPPRQAAAKAPEKTPAAKPSKKAPTKK